MKAFVVFGSDSDKSTYEPLCEKLREAGHMVEYETISAHRNPDRLEVALKEKDYQVVIAGAGLSAHLPGVVASKIENPVIGIPVNAHFGGFDALMSIVQMPFGVPVLSTPTNDPYAGISFITKMEKLEREDFNKITLVIDNVDLNYEFVNLELNRTKEYLAAEGIEFEISSEPKGGINIVFVTKEKMFFRETSGAVINVPIFDNAKKKTVSAAMDLFDFINKAGGLWVGVTNSRNAIKSVLKFRGALYGK